MLEQLKQLTKVTWDGNLICKSDRDNLVKIGLADRLEGFNFITKKGLKYLIDLDEYKDE